MIFTGYFIRENKSLGSVISEAEDVDAAIERTIFDAIFQSPWTRDDVLVLAIRDHADSQIVYAVNDEAKTFDYASVLGV